MRVWGLGFRVQGSGFRVQGSGSKVQGSGSRVQGPGLMVEGYLGLEDRHRMVEVHLGPVVLLPRGVGGGVVPDLRSLGYIYLYILIYIYIYIWGLGLQGCGAYGLWLRSLIEGQKKSMSNFPGLLSNACTWGMRVVHLGRSNCHAISGRGD